MAKFKVSAPGRIFLSGEHTKMYEKNVITAGLNLRTTLTFSELPDENINIKFPDVKLSLILPIEQILNFFYDEDLNLRCNNTRRLLEHVQFFITSNGMWSTYEQKHSLQIFLFLLLWSSKSENFDIRPFHVHVTTQLPMNAGFGSSTSFAVCLAGCFLHWSRLQKGNYNNDFDNDELLKIVQLVMACEEDEIDYACMIDQLVCAFGEIMLFRCQHPTNYYKFLHTSLTIDILLIDSKIRPNKYAPMLQIAKMKHTNSANTNHLLDLINTASIMTYHTLHEMSNYHRNNNLQQLTKLYVLFAVCQMISYILYTQLHKIMDIWKNSQVLDMHAFCYH
ncbi:mevalonate kinase-like isoform X2 [Anoplolepis gracilipes]|uniref:mevalonate kinase-like isoform X2 n=1 Tax=Anoplolepis gracilipes TaxID=354296 RepID=UPI003BA2A9D9